MESKRNIPTSRPPDICPNCKASLISGDIVEELIAKSGMSRQEANQVAVDYYNYGESNKYFYNVIGLYSRDKDKVVEWQCLFCKHTWTRLSDY